jgi:DNA-binding IclR family transcriptional regulator
MATRQVLNALRIVASSEEPIGVAEVSRRLDTPTSTTHRSLATLEEARYIERLQHSSKFVPGVMTAQLVRALFERYKIRAASAPYLRQLATGTQSGVTLSVRIGWYSMRVSVIEPAQPNYRVQRLGTTSLLHQGAASRAILAFLPDTEVRKFLDFLERSNFSQEEKSSRRAILEDLRAIRKQGYVYEMLPFGDDRAIVAIPIRNVEKAVAAVTIQVSSSSSDALADKKGRRWIRVVQQLEDLLRERPDISADPFSHIDPNEIVLAITPEP